MVSARPMKPDEIYDVFLSVLRVHGFAAVPSGSMPRGDRGVDGGKRNRAGVKAPPSGALARNGKDVANALLSV